MRHFVAFAILKSDEILGKMHQGTKIILPDHCRTHDDFVHDGIHDHIGGGTSSLR